MSGRKPNGNGWGAMEGSLRNTGRFLPEIRIQRRPSKFFETGPAYRLMKGAIT